MQDSEGSYLIHEFDLVDRYEWTMDRVKIEALYAARRRGEMLDFMPESVEITGSTSTRDGEAYHVRVYGRYTNEFPL
jgi:hypothetical protein